LSFELWAQETRWGGNCEGALETRMGGGGERYR
jgi:hypothetical protein